ncbi:MAG: hypothetical protein R2838_24715 [Caldilineaceae bacterium]
MRRILAGLRDAGGMMLVHAEDNDMAEASIPGFLARGQTAPIFPMPRASPRRWKTGPWNAASTSCALWADGSSWCT